MWVALVLECDEVFEHPKHPHIIGAAPAPLDLLHSPQPLHVRLELLRYFDQGLRLDLGDL